VSLPGGWGSAPSQGHISAAPKLFHLPEPPVGLQDCGAELPNSEDVLKQGKEKELL